MKIIDVHTHIWDTFCGWDSYKNLVSELKKSMKKNKIGVIVGIINASFLKPPAKEILNDIKDDVKNERLLDAKYTDSFYLRPFCKNLGHKNGMLNLGLPTLRSLNSPNIHNYFQDFEEKIKDLQVIKALRIDDDFNFKKHGDVIENAREKDFKILKVYSNIYKQDFLKNIANYAKEFDYKILLFHTKPTINIDEISKFVSKYDLLAILGHGCYPDLINATKDNESIFFDTSSRGSEEIKKFIQAGLEDRLLFGSDWPQLNNPKKQEEEIKKITNLDKGLKENIFYKNFEKIYKI